MNYSSFNTESSLAAWRWVLLRWLLRICGLVDCLAIFVVFLSPETITKLHSLMGQDPFPQTAISYYMARSASLMYVAHGVLLIYVSFDTQRWFQLIRVLAIISVLHGLILIYIDNASGMPWWWTLVEGPLLASWGIVVLVLTHHKKKPC